MKKLEDLTPHQERILKWYLEGDSFTLIAQRLRISQPAIFDTFTVIKRKLKVIEIKKQLELSYLNYREERITVIIKEKET